MTTDIKKEVLLDQTRTMAQRFIFEDRIHDSDMDNREVFQLIASERVTLEELSEAFKQGITESYPEIRKCHYSSLDVIGAVLAIAIFAAVGVFLISVFVHATVTKFQA